MFKAYILRTGRPGQLTTTLQIMLPISNKSHTRCYFSVPKISLPLHVLGRACGCGCVAKKACHDHNLKVWNIATDIIVLPASLRSWRKKHFNIYMGCFPLQYCLAQVFLELLLINAKRSLKCFFLQDLYEAGGTIISAEILHTFKLWPCQN